MRTTVSLADDVAAAVQRAAKNARSGRQEAVNGVIRARLTKRQVAKSVPNGRRTTWARESTTQHIGDAINWTARQAANAR